MRGIDQQFEERLAERLVGSGDALARRLQPTRDVAAYDAYLGGKLRT